MRPTKQVIHIARNRVKNLPAHRATGEASEFNQSFAARSDARERTARRTTAGARARAMRADSPPARLQSRMTRYEQRESR